MQSLQERTCARVSFLIKLQASVCNFIKNETLAQIFCEIFENIFFTEHLRTTASDHSNPSDTAKNLRMSFLIWVHSLGNTLNLTLSRFLIFFSVQYLDHSKVMSAIFSYLAYRKFIKNGGKCFLLYQKNPFCSWNIQICGALRDLVPFVQF